MKFLFASALALSAASASAVSLVGLTSDGRLASFDSATPGTSTSIAITGLASATDRLVGIDLRTSNQTLYGVSLSDNLYAINFLTGAATLVGSGLGVDLTSANGYGVDTNPVADALRVVSSTGANYAVNFTTGVAAINSNIAPGVSAVAYTPAAAGATSLYYLNSTTDSISVASTGFANPALTFVGNLGVDALKANGFEIAADGTAFAALNVDGSSLVTGIYSIGLAGAGAGAATLIGEYKGTLSGLTIAPIPEPGTYALMALGLAAVGASARRRSRG